ncbi:hypothetical protein [Dyella choica]|uniref:Uncharacterized protein n=1 Tax=Dyella choica TaxID=1927959 RepID=A0A432M1N7_9GAMM|nr:hypothetical protein [Dyella choica]RUL71435.1 hypothetical protein EKH80_18785 [Dyella choica]
MLKRALVGLVIFGGLLFWRYGANATMPTLEKEAALAPPAGASSVTFKRGTWACTAEEFKRQLLDGKYYAHPVVIKFVGNGPPEFCREINISHDYALLTPASTDTQSTSPCPDHSCTAFNARVSVAGHEDDWVLYAPNSFISSTR